MSVERRPGTLFYVYALTDDAGQRRFISGARRLRTIEIDGVSAVVELVREPRPATETALREQHELVRRLARRFDALLPVRFGAVFTPSELDARIESNHRIVRRALDRVRGRVQMTVRLHGASGDAVPRDTSGTAFLVARSERARALRRHVALLRRAVSRFIDDERIDPGKGDLMGTVYHLIRERHVEDYTRAVASAAPAFAAVRLMVTGPWPVFAFVPELRSRGGSTGSRGR